VVRKQLLHRRRSLFTLKPRRQQWERNREAGKASVRATLSNNLETRGEGMKGGAPQRPSSSAKPSIKGPPQEGRGGKGGSKKGKPEKDGHGESECRQVEKSAGRRRGKKSERKKHGGDDVEGGKRGSFHALKWKNLQQKVLSRGKIAKETMLRLKSRHEGS